MKIKTIKATGLIPVRLLRASLPYREGQVVGFLPKLVARLLSADPPDAELVEIPATFDTEEIEVILDNEIPPATPAVPAAPAVIEIPEKWDKGPDFKRIALAQNFDPTVQTDDDAKKVIAAELARRSGPPTP